MITALPCPFILWAAPLCMSSWRTTSPPMMVKHSPSPPLSPGQFSSGLQGSSLLCPKNGFWGTFLESQRSCVHGSFPRCASAHPLHHRAGTTAAPCAAWPTSRSHALQQGLQAGHRGPPAEPQNVDSERSGSSSSARDRPGLPGPRLKYLLQKMDYGLYVHHLHQQRDPPRHLLRPRWAQRLSLTLKTTRTAWTSSTW